MKIEIPADMMTCAKCDLNLNKAWDAGAGENLCQNCGQYFCDTCWDTHSFDMDCEPCSDCGQIHITESCQAQPR